MVRVLKETKQFHCDGHLRNSNFCTLYMLLNIVLKLNSQKSCFFDKDIAIPVYPFPDV